MRLRPIHLPLVSYRSHRLLHSRINRLEETHYETLQIPVTATQSEIKKAFYTLSKTCHPDCNPSDPQASNRFIALSAAYSILGTPSTRASYDSTLLKYHPQHEISTTRGTYSSTNPVGGRSPSGLSRRRAQFRGPPPSFYRNGGWGSFTEKRQNSHKETTNPAKSKTNSDVDAQEFGDFGPGQNLYKYVNNDDLHHFDREQHLQTQENHRKRWQSRKKGNGQIIDEDLPKGLLGPFITVAGILTIGIILPLSYLRIS